MTTTNYSIRTQLTQAPAPGREEAAAPCVSDLAANNERGWESLEVRKILATELTGWVAGLANWTTFVTLTFKENRFPDVAWALYRWFVSTNNVHAFGRHYTRKVGHSYFSYAVGMEYQTRDVVHFHLLVDKPLDFNYVHATWGDRCGYAWIDTDLKDKDRVISYVCKYVLKGGQVDVYKAMKDYAPANLPTWWKDRSGDLSRVVQGTFFRPGQLAQPLTGGNHKREISTITS